MAEKNPKILLFFSLSVSKRTKDKKLSQKIKKITL